MSCFFYKYYKNIYDHYTHSFYYINCEASTHTVQASDSSYRSHLNLLRATQNLLRATYMKSKCIIRPTVLLYADQVVGNKTTQRGLILVHSSPIYFWPLVGINYPERGLDLPNWVPEFRTNCLACGNWNLSL